MQCACDLLSSVACLVLQYFSTLSHGYQGTDIEQEMCVLIFSITLSETFLIIRRIGRDMTKMYIGLHVSSTRYSCPVLIKLEFSRQIFEAHWTWN